MKSCVCTILASLIAVSFSISANARDTILPAGTILRCVLNEPNFSSSTVEIGDPVLCHLRGLMDFNEQAFPRGSYLVGHLVAAKDPGHFFGKGYLKLEFDRIGVPGGDVPLNAKVIGTRGYKVDREGKIDGKGHAKRDVAEWMLPPLWPWKVMMLPARGPRPKLKNEAELSLRLMDDVQIPQIGATFGRESHPIDQFQRESLREPVQQQPRVLTPRGSGNCLQRPRPSQTYGPGWHFFGESRSESSPHSEHDVSQPTIRDLPSIDPVPMGAPAISYSTSISDLNCNQCRRDSIR